MKERTDNRAPRAEIDPALVRQARSGDQAAFAALYEQTNPALYRSVRAMVRDEDLVWDVLQNTWLRAFRSLDRLEADEAFLPWLRRIAVNETARLTAERQPIRFTELGDGEDEPLAELPDLRAENQPEPALDRKETARLVREILGELPAQQQLVLGMRYYEDLSVKEIAELLNVSSGTVKKQLHLGRRKVEGRVRALERQGVKLYGMGPLPFLLALLGRLEPGAAEQAALASALNRAAAAGGTAAAAAAAGDAAGMKLTAMTAGQAFLHGLGGKLAAGLLAALMIGGGIWAGAALLKRSAPEAGELRPTGPGFAETEENLRSSTEQGGTPERPSVGTEQAETPEDLPETREAPETEPPAPPIMIASGRFGLRQREGQGVPGDGTALPYFRVVDPETEDRRFTNNAVELRYDGSGVLERELPDGEERLLFALERTAETDYRLFGVSDDRLFFTCKNPEEPDNWWGATAFSTDRRGRDRRELGDYLDCFFGDGWVALRSFHTDVRPSTARIFNRSGELILEEPEERVWSMEAVDGSLYVVCVKEHPQESGGSRWYDDVIRLDPDGTQSLLLQIPVFTSPGDYGVEANIFNGVISFDGPDGTLYDLYTLEPLETRYDSSLYDDSLTWTLDSSGVLTVSGSGDMGDCWPQPWEEYRETITELVLEDGVTNIGSNAFSDCAALRRVSLPDSLTHIGDAAFSQCAALTSVTIPDSVTQLDRAVFDGCSALTDVTLPAGLTGISDNLFFACGSLQRVVLPDSVRAIGNYAFNRCAALTGIAIPSAVTSVGERAFWRCPALTDVTLPAGVTEIGAEAFGWNVGTGAESERVPGFTLRGAEGSAAQTYAEENGFRFIKAD